MADKAKTVKWQGTAGIEQVNTLKDSLLDAFKKSSEVRLDISKVDDIDITGIQVILAAKKEAEKTGKEFFLTGEIPSVIDDFTKASAISLKEYHVDYVEEIMAQE